MGELEEALRKISEIEKALESSHKKEAMDPIMMDDEHTKEIIRKEGVMRNR